MRRGTADRGVRLLASRSTWLPTTQGRRFGALRPEDPHPDPLPRGEGKDVGLTRERGQGVGGAERFDRKTLTPTLSHGERGKTRDWRGSRGQDRGGAGRLDRKTPHPNPLLQAKLLCNPKLGARKTPHRFRPKTPEPASPPGEGKERRLLKEIATAHPAASTSPASPMREARGRAHDGGGNAKVFQDREEERPAKGSCDVPRRCSPRSSGEEYRGRVR